ncbi:class I SAM-dependent methyltransferase [Numidum massiliense]|uniref:class I SAM-dependent methyltransferase n=1 Tax=Numidum massiliense TaxID=1522315 RepID=UPI0006D54DB2|nr:class I SAM-dependent methyltransferase [Numidum massiliense]
MTNTAEKNRWEKKYKERPQQLMEPEAYLVQNSHLLKRGSVLDFACGDGRNAIYLAKLGFRVTGVDFAREALRRLHTFATARGVTVCTEQLDLTTTALGDLLGTYDNIVISRYKPDAVAFQQLPAMLHTGGILLISTFNYRQARAKGISRKFCLEENELVHYFPELTLRKYESFSDVHGFHDGYVFQK